MPELIELRPNSSLLDPNFNGYKLSLDKIPVLTKTLETPVDRVLPKSDQYSLLFVKLFGLHNHLINDQYNSENNVFFIDKAWNVNAVTVNPLNGQLKDPIQVWQIPENRERQAGCYNVSLCFASADIAVLSDGTGVLHVLETGDRTKDEMWRLVYSDEITGEHHSFIVVDALCKTENGRSELHCILLSVEYQDEKIGTVLNWVVLNKTEDNSWGAVGLKVLRGAGGIDYCCLETDCKALYLVSDQNFKFILDSDNPIVEKNEVEVVEKVYTWMQTGNELTLRFNLCDNYVKDNIKIDVNPSHISVHYRDVILLNGDLIHRVDSELTTWLIDARGLLELTLMKTESGLMWSNVVQGDKTGEQILDHSLVEEAHHRLAHLCSENEVVTEESGLTFSSQQIEECDFEGDKSSILERLCSTTHEITHKVILGSHQVILTVRLQPDQPPALGLRHDVDTCLWQPVKSSNKWDMCHEGTLLAFGYVQASKQQKKFSSCSPDLSYSVICESCRHVFIYRQNKPVTSGVLRNRTTGKRVGSTAQQQVVSLSEEEVLGLHASNSFIFLLTENKLLALQV